MSFTQDKPVTILPVWFFRTNRHTTEIQGHQYINARKTATEMHGLRFMSGFYDLCPYLAG